MNDAIETETRKHAGLKVTVEWFAQGDLFGSEPWKDDDGAGIVSEWRHLDTKRPGERILHRDGSSCLFYDWKATIEKAKKDGWDAPPYKTGTKGEQAERAVEADFKSLQRFCRGDWFYVGRTVTIEGIEYPDSSVWGFDSDYMKEETENCFKGAFSYIDQVTEETIEACPKLFCFLACNPAGI